jgi:hypothetical protein
LVEADAMRKQSNRINFNSVVVASIQFFCRKFTLKTSLNRIMIIKAFSTDELQAIENFLVVSLGTQVFMLQSEKVKIAKQSNI